MQNAYIKSFQNDHRSFLELNFYRENTNHITDFTHTFPHSLPKLTCTSWLTCNGSKAGILIG